MASRVHVHSFGLVIELFAGDHSTCVFVRLHHAEWVVIGDKEQ